MTRRNSKASKPISKTNKKQNPNTSSETSGPGSGNPAQVRFVTSFRDILEKIQQEIPAWDLRSISEEDFIEAINQIISFTSEKINTGGEPSYISKKAALFLTELMHGALRRNVKSYEVPPLHATLIDSMYSSIDSARTGLFDESEVDVQSLEDAVKESRQVLKNLQLQAKVGKLVLPS